MLSYFTSNCQIIEKDSVLVAIDDIKLVNVVFSDYDRLNEEVRISSTINSISVSIIKVEEKVTDNLEVEVDNLRKVIELKNKANELEIENQKRKTKKARTRANITTVGAILLVVLLL